MCKALENHSLFSPFMSPFQAQLLLSLDRSAATFFASRDVSPALFRLHFLLMMLWAGWLLHGL